VLLAAAVWCWWFSWRGSVPFEDAKMLFRYVDNVVAGHGVVWNVGEALVAGATDLGFMFLLAAVRTFGVGAQTAALIVNSLAFLAVAGGMFVFAPLRQIPPVPAMLCIRPFLPQSSGDVDTRGLRCGLLRCIDSTCERSPRMLAAALLSLSVVFLAQLGDTTQLIT
jgi:hypothetical protein